MDSTQNPKHISGEPGFANAITAAHESEENSLSIPEIGERVAAAVGIDADQAIRAVQIVQEYSHGPIPSAIELQKLNAIEPSLGTNIAKDYLLQRQHERQMDTKTVELANRDSARKDGWLSYTNRGQAFGLVSQFIFVAGAFGAMYLHYEYLALALVAAPALGVITRFIKGRESIPASESKDGI